MEVAHDTNQVYKIMKTKLLSLLVILFMGFAVVSCSSDDKDDDGGNNTEVVESLVGTWKCTFSTGYQLVTFKSNGKGTLLEVDEEDEDYEEAFTYTYNASSKTLKINWEDDDPEQWQVVSLTSKKLVVLDEDGGRVTFTKQ